MNLVVHLLGHYDDEYCALPLISAFAKAGADQRFFYLTEPVRGAVGEVRRAESLALLRRFGVDPAAVVHLGRDLAINDQGLHSRLDDAWAAIAQTSGPQAATVVTPAWEGGHVDHDLCAVLAAALAARTQGQALQFGLYNGKGLAGPLFRAATPLPENGPAERAAMSAGDWLAFAGAVRFFPSQAPVWSTLWPAMFARYARAGFRYQRLEPGRVRQRPHAGALLYERRGHADYAMIRQAADAFLDRTAPDA